MSPEAQPSVNGEAPLIQVRNATVWRGSTRVFDGLSLSIGQGERVAVLGPNGAGKTTLLKLIDRELYPVAREDSWVRILGRERWDVWELRRHIGWVSDDLQSGFLPTSTVLEAVLSGFFSSIGIHPRLWEKVTGTQRERAEAVLRQMGLEQLHDRAFSTLSTGQRRRCLLGRALVHDPEALILDEPTAGLDLAASLDFLRRIRELARGGRSLVLVTHHLGDIPPEIERVILLQDGRVAADGPKREVLTGERLSRLYGVPLQVAEVDGHFFAYPAG